MTDFRKRKIDNWTKYGDCWSVRCESDAVEVNYNGQSVLAVPYDMPIMGCKTNNIGTLRLWRAEPLKEFDFDLFNQQKYLDASRKIFAEDISRVLYPNDDSDGKLLRLKQQYFFCSASLEDILKSIKVAHGTLENLADYVTIQLNDTHPVISIPELMRRLMDIEGFSYGKAFDIVCRVFNYTNHTIMQEALENGTVVLLKSFCREFTKSLLC